MASSTLLPTQLTASVSSCPCGREKVGLLWVGGTSQSETLEGGASMKDLPEGMRLGFHGVRMLVKRWWAGGQELVAWPAWACWLAQAGRDDGKIEEQRTGRGLVLRGCESEAEEFSSFLLRAMGEL